MKQVILVRKDLKMEKGKMCAQVAHASVEAIGVFKEGNKIRFPSESAEKDYFKWKNIGQKKVVVYVDDESDLEEYHLMAFRAGLPCSLIKDAGLTAFNGIVTKTCVGIGPAEDKLIDAITKDLKLV